MGKIKEGEIFTIGDDENEDQEVEVLGSMDIDDTEFGAEFSQSKKARKKAARERKNNS